jgi:hypothetical protein
LASMREGVPPPKYTVGNWVNSGKRRESSVKIALL